MRLVIEVILSVDMLKEVCNPSHHIFRGATIDVIFDEVGNVL